MKMFEKIKKMDEEQLARFLTKRTCFTICHRMNEKCIDIDEEECILNIMIGLEKEIE